jgi:putative PIN family toxin of toxin-antitoxin system
VLRVVIDPGVLIAAVISAEGVPRSLLLAWIDGGFELVASPMLFAELQRVLQREKFRRYVSLRDAKAYVALLRRFATIHPDVNVESRLCSDPGDEYLIALAAAQNVNYLVSGDSHLTNIKNPPIPIVSPRTLADRLGLS